MGVPVGQDGYLSGFAFLDPPLLLGTFVSFLKYPTSFIVKAPISSLALLTVLLVPVPEEVLTALGVQDGTGPAPLSLVDLSFSLLETVLFARIFLQQLLAERNQVLAQSILRQCQLQKQQRQAPWSNFLGAFWNKKDDSSIMYAPDSVLNDEQSQSQGTVVCVLGMAHVNGIKKILIEQNVAVNSKT